MAALPQELENVPDVPREALAIVKHAYETFGSSKKAIHWLERPNPIFGGPSAMEVLRCDPTKYELVEDELTRIDYGVFV